MVQIIDQSGITQRINDLIKESGMSVHRFAHQCKLDPSLFTKKTKGKQVWTVNDVNKINENMQIRKGWLVDGEGQKYKAPDKVLDTVPVIPKRSYDTRVGVPYYTVAFELGFDDMENDQSVTPAYMIDFAPYNKCTAWCNARGDSMSPTISSGDMIALKKIDDFNLFMNDYIYAIVTYNGLRTIKRVRDNGDTVTLIPDNKEDFSEQTINKKDIIRAYQVVGCVKIF